MRPTRFREIPQVYVHDIHDIHGIHGVKVEPLDWGDRGHSRETTRDTILQLVAQLEESLHSYAQ